MPEHCGAILIGVLVKHDAGGRTGQQPRELGLALDKGQRPLILAVELKQVEGIAVPGMAAAD